MNGLKNSCINFIHPNLLKNINEKIELNKNEAQDLFSKDSKDKLFDSNYNKNIFSQNIFEENFLDEYYNYIYMYYNSTIQYFKSCYYNSFYLPNTKNFIPKLKKDKFQTEEQIHNNSKINKNINFLNDSNKIKEMNKNIDYNFNYNYSLNQNKNDDLINNLQFLDKTTINNNLNALNNSYFFDPNNNLTKISSNNIENENESLSTSDKTSPTFSAKMEKTTNFFSLDNKIKNDENSNSKNEDEYLVEMFGKKGWVCLLCNNFNYETRVKCNRCGVIKKPKCINKKMKNENKKYDFKERCNKKGDWICSNCKNLNYSFRTICNRCKFPKINYYIFNQINSKNENIINNNNMQPYCISPTFIVFNNIPNIFINNYGHTRNNEE